MEWVNQGKTNTRWKVWFRSGHFGNYFPHYLKTNNYLFRSNSKLWLELASSAKWCHRYCLLTRNKYFPLIAPQAYYRWRWFDYKESTIHFESTARIEALICSMARLNDDSPNHESKYEKFLEILDLGDIGKSFRTLNQGTKTSWVIHTWIRSSAHKQN